MGERVRALAGLVDDLFELARIDAGALTLELRESPLEAVVASCLRGIEAEASARSVSISSAIGERLPQARCAPESVERVLLNLLANALRHTPSDGTVAVQVRAVEAEVQRDRLGHGGGDPADGQLAGSSSGSGARTARAAATAPVWDSPSPRASSRRKAGGSGPSTAPTAARR